MLSDVGLRSSSRSYCMSVYIFFNVAHSG